MMMLTACASSRRDFNSIKVRLELIYNNERGGMYKFQFHKGTIRTYCKNYYKIYRLEFQFHKGTIRTYNGAFGNSLKSISIP